MFKFGYEGKACLLRAICEMHESPLIGYGFFGEVLELFLTWVYTTISHCIIFPIINQRNLYWLPISNLIVIFQFVFWRENSNFWLKLIFWGPKNQFLAPPVIFEKSSRKILYNEKEEPIEGVISLAWCSQYVLKVDCKIMWARATNLGFYWDLKARCSVGSWNNFQCCFKFLKYLDIWYLKNWTCPNLHFMTKII